MSLNDVFVFKSYFDNFRKDAWRRFGMQKYETFNYSDELQHSCNTNGWGLKIILTL